MTLEELRAKIDGLDSDIVSKLNERAVCAQAIAAIKRDSNAPFYVPEREKEVFRRLLEGNAGPLSNSAIGAIYREIVSAIRTLEKATTVAFLGPKDTFSHMAALRIFGASAEYHPLPSFSDVFTEVERERIDYGVVPVESSMGGSVSDTLDRFIDSDLKIINEIMLHVTQHLLSNSRLEEITRVYSKDNALLQCRNWLRANLPRAELVEVSSTAEAARRASGEVGSGAIASRLAAETYGLEFVGEHIEDAAHNYTRFFVVGQQMVRPTGDDKTSVLISVKDVPGALYALLLPFSKADISLSRIESRPSQKKAWEYVFFVDLVGHVEDEEVKAVLAEVSEQSTNMKVLGSYPRADLDE